MPKKSFTILFIGFLVCLNISFAVSNYLIFGKWWKDGQAYPSLFLVTHIVALFSFLVVRIPNINAATQIPQLVSKLLEHVFVLSFIVLIYWFAVNSPHYYKEGIAIFFATYFILTFIFSKLYINYLRGISTAVKPRTTLIVGNSTYAGIIKEALAENKYLGFSPLSKSYKYLPQSLEELKTLVTSKELKAVFLDYDSFQMSEKMEKNLREISELFDVRFYAFSNYFGNKFTRSSYNLVEHHPYISLFKYPLDSLANILLKRIFDILFSLFIIIFIFSWLLPIIAMLIIIDSGFPVFFTQKRHGMDNRVFNCFKFRTMVNNKHSNEKITVKNDPRITPLGKILRKTSIDELPQFFNVLLGDMSVVGPRPHMVNQNNHYKTLIKRYNFRHYVKPGITGLAQVEGYRGEIKEEKDMRNRVLADINYIRNWSFKLDLQIIYRTILKTIKGDQNAI
ncbi:MAG: exopolysaccharide biosynthesis polyprenyl glycosylphosphotransferase [Weeksellaceae bacterium]|nr:exopolysaccharide biosynthesis polyprenyl glycosylphosphotransferase [Weeksellaceae bacterium]